MSTKTPNSIDEYADTGIAVLWVHSKGEWHAVLLDVEDVPSVSQHRWWMAGQGYVGAYICGTGESVRLHRFLLNPPSHLEVDHKNHDKLDHRKVNLRICTRRTNLYNNTRPRSNTGHLNIHLLPSGGLRVIVGNRWVGTFGTIGLAIAARDSARTKIESTPKRVRRK